MSRSLSLAIVTLIAALSVITMPAAAQQYTPEVQKEARTLFLELMSPYCPGLSLYSCRSGAAETLREQIRNRLAAGDSAEEIKADLVEQFGESVLGAPKNRGFGRLAWLGPIAVLLVGLGMIFRWLRRNSRKPADVAADPELDASIQSRVESELKTHRG